MEEKPPPPDDDDYRERDISEDPFLATVDADLNSVNRRNDYKLGIAIRSSSRRHTSTIVPG